MVRLIVALCLTVLTVVASLGESSAGVVRGGSGQPALLLGTNPSKVERQWPQNAAPGTADLALSYRYSNRDTWRPRYKPQRLVYISEYDGEFATVAINVWLPGVDEVRVTVNGEGKSLVKGHERGREDYWEASVTVPVGTLLTFEAMTNQITRESEKKWNGKWQEFVPLATVFLQETANGLVVHEPASRSRITRSGPGRPRLVFEGSFQSVLRGIRGSMPYLSNLELFRAGKTVLDLWRRLNASEFLAKHGATHFMTTVSRSMVDFMSPMANPLFNYLGTGFVNLHDILATPKEFLNTLSDLESRGIEVIVDAVLVHQVRKEADRKSSLDTLKTGAAGKSPYVDDEAYHFRDYGTWMAGICHFELARVIVEQVTAFFVDTGLKTMRADYFDGLVLQFLKRYGLQNRDVNSIREEIVSGSNYGYQLVKELKESLYRHGIKIVGETFTVAHAIEPYLDGIYKPFFQLLRAVLEPPRGGNPSHWYDELIGGLNDLGGQSRPYLAYVLSHDEAFECEQITEGRKYDNDPGCYGAHLGQLALNACRKQGHRFESDAECMFRTIRLVAAVLLWGTTSDVMVSELAPLAVGTYDQDPQVNLVRLPDSFFDELNVGLETPLSKKEISGLHEKHKTAVKRTMQIRNGLTPIGERDEPLVRSRSLNHYDPDNGVVATERWNAFEPTQRTLMIANTGVVSHLDGYNVRLESTEHNFYRPGTKFEVIDVSDGELMGLGEIVTAQRINGKSTITMPSILARGFYILKMLE